jgi:hypothetical protein
LGLGLESLLSRLINCISKQSKEIGDLHQESHRMIGHTSLIRDQKSKVSFWILTLSRSWP